MTHLPVTIPEGYTLLIKKGDNVAVGDRIAEKITEDEQTPQKEEKNIDVSSLLSLRPSKVRSYLKKGPGNTIKPGDTIAEKPQTLGLKSQKLISTIAGTVTKFDRMNGILYIEQEGSVEKKPERKIEEIYSPLDGTVESVSDTEVQIKGKGTGLTAVKGVGGVGEGALFPIESEEEKVVSTDIIGDCAGKIIMVDGITREALAKASAVDVAGIISTRIADEDLDYIEEKRLPVPVVEVTAEIFRKLKKEKGSVITLHGSMKMIQPHSS